MFFKISKRFFSQTAERVVHIEHLGKGVHMFSLNRPTARNALSVQLIDELHDAIREYNEATCVILRSLTPGMFCAGADLKERKGMSEDEVNKFLRDMKATFIHLENMSVPTISVVDGAALGGGCELSLCTDMRIATNDAFFALPETGLAIIPGAGGT
jgi:methylglutaconyl-CoA hydratase